MTLSEYISNYRKENHLSLRALAEKSGCSFQYIAKLEKGQVDNPSILMLKKLASAMGITLNDLFSSIDDLNVNLSDDSESSNPIQKVIDTVRSIVIPLYTLICCGNGGFVDDNIIDYITLPSDLLIPSKDYFAQRASGNSMINADIHDGDILVFEKTGHIENGQIGCFCIDDNEAMCKRYRVKTDEHGHVIEIVLIPANDDIVKYPPIVIDAQMEHFRCIGRLVLDISNMEKR